MMPSKYAQQANSLNAYSNLSSVASTNWGPTPSLTRDMAYSGFETGYGANDMFGHGMVDDPMLVPEDGLEDYDFHYSTAE